MNTDRKTHKDEDAFGILLPAFDHFVVFLLCSLAVQGEERTRAVNEDGFFQLLSLVAIIYFCELGENRLKLYLTRTCVSPPLEVSETTLRH